MDVYPEGRGRSKRSLGQVAIESRHSRSLVVLLVVFAVAVAGVVGMMAYQYYQANQIREKIAMMMGLSDTSEIDFSADAINARNSKRKYDLLEFISAATNYQSNNNGKSPFGTNNGKIFGGFVNRYIDGGCPVVSDSNYLYFEDGCSEEFMDPFGVTYRMKYEGNMTAEDVRLDLKEFDFEIKAVGGAQCNAKAKYKVSAVGGIGLYALVYVGEGGEILCADNS